MSSHNSSVYNAITGFSFTTNLRMFLTVDDFKRCVSQQLMIPLDQTFILLPFGAKLKKDTFANCLRDTNPLEFYVFDRRLFSFAQDPNSSALSPETPEIEDLLATVTQHRQPTLIKPVPSPLLEVNLSSSDFDYRKATTILTTNMGWLSALEIDAHYFHSIIQNTMVEIRVIFQCFSICSQYLKVYCFEIEKLYNSNVEFLNQLTKESNALEWQKVYDGLLKNLSTVNGEKEKRLSDFLRKNELENHFNELVDVNNNVTTLLRQVKSQIDDNFKTRQEISSKVEALKPAFDQSPSKYEMEDTMMARFEEMITETKQSTRETLTLSSAEFTPEMLSDLNHKISDDKNSTVPNLFTIAQSLFSQAEKSLADKRRLQEQIILLLSQIAFVQVQILDVKTVLLTDCNHLLEILQKCELQLSQVDDLPVLYGLHLIEKLRRRNWLNEIRILGSRISDELLIIGDLEQRHREKWGQTFVQLNSIFEETDTDLSDFRKSQTVRIGSLSTSKEDLITADKIERYLLQLSENEVSAESLALLQRNLESAMNTSIAVKPTMPGHSVFSGEKPHYERDIVRHYQRRIKKLESLLHDAKYSNIRSWPSGILNSASLPAFEKNVSAVNVKMSMLLADSNETALSNSQGEAFGDTAQLRTELEHYQKQVEQMRKDSLKLKKQVVDFEDERNAYRETLSVLNQEISKITSEKEKNDKLEITKAGELKNQVLSLGKDNISLVNEVISWKEKCELKTKEQEHQARLQEEMMKDKMIIEKDYENAKNTLSEESARLQEELASLKADNEELRFNQELATTKNEEKKAQDHEQFVRLNHDMLTRIFELFAGAVYILENIGLLLSSTEDFNFQIARVKGLRKGMAQSDILESAVELKGPTTIKSAVFQDVKNVFESSHELNDVQVQNDLMAAINKLFGNKLYETSVIKRFKDIEALAKKLTKENKVKRGLLETYKREKITVKNFQVGDTALFLPTRDVPDSVSSSVSSLASSFSSVDLSTPPPPGGGTMQKGEHHHGKITKDGSTSNKAVPWAAFTAFDESTRYFLKENEKFTADRDWFVGRITSVERMVVKEASFNPFKLPKGTAWVQVAADFVTGKEF
ncbi:LAFA_0F16402g1_1 [Lachancea sp. 'fantastica']|nr:LAFA_0F16402g1_1 [Lachancea sp. 'fantastica']